MKSDYLTGEPRAPSNQPDQLPPPLAKVQVLDRAFIILDCFTRESPELGIGEISRLTGISKGTVHRLLATLLSHRIIEQNPETKQYRLGFKLFELGNRAIARVDHIAQAEFFLKQLADATGETAHLAMLDQGMTFYVAKVEGWHSLRMPSQVGKHLPTYCTGVGKALIAYLKGDELSRVLDQHDLVRYTPKTITSRSTLEKELAKTRKRGYAVDDEEIEPGLRCIAAPIRDYSGSVIASLSIAGPTMRITKQSIPTLAQHVMRTSNAISASLGAPGITDELLATPPAIRA